MTADPHSDLRLTAAIDGDRTRIGVCGNLDCYTAPLLRAELARASRTPVPHTTVVLTTVGLIDSSGLSALVYGYKLSRARGGEFTLCGGDRSVARLLARTGLDRVMPLRSDEGAAAGTVEARAAHAGTRAPVAQAEVQGRNAPAAVPPLGRRP